MSDIPELDNILDAFTARVIERAQRNIGAVRTVNGKKRRAVATGTLKNSLVADISQQPNGSLISFGWKPEAQKYGPVVEGGRRAGARMPPIEPIVKWIKQKPVRLQKAGGGFIKMTDANINSAAFRIAKAIAKNGIPGVFYYRDAIEAELASSAPEFLTALEAELTKRLSEIANGNNNS